jgi:ABC-type uncharacterized transport system substrate-binding protein
MLVFMICLALGLPLLAARTTSAHPHVFVASEAEVLSDEEGLTGIRQVWYFDEAFSASILADYDADKDFAFNSAESKAVENGAFINLKHFHFFTNLKVSGQSLKPQDYRDFAVGMKDDMLYYAFTIPFQKSVSGGELSFTMFNYDPEYYVDFYVGMGPKMHIDENAHYVLEVKYEDDYSAANTLYMIPPVLAKITLKRK